jgi:hypothetical protein
MLPPPRELIASQPASQPARCDTAGLQVSVTNRLARYAELAGQLERQPLRRARPSDRRRHLQQLCWICPVAPDHKWAATSSSRVRLGAGRPACKLVAVSIREVRLAAELAGVPLARSPRPPS